MNWYYFSEGREVGPLSVTALGEIRASGGIADETPVRREDSAEWEAYSTAFHPKLETQQDVNPSADKPAFKFECPHCQQHISTDEDYSGKTVQCPTCGEEFVVPQPPEEMEPMDPRSGVSDEDKSTDMPSSQKPAVTYSPQAPRASDSFDKRVKDSPVAMKKGRGKSKFQTIAVAAVIMMAVAVGALLLTKTKSNDKVVKEDVPQINQSDSANEPDEPNQVKQDDDDVSGPSLDLAKYAKESAERGSRQNQDQQQDFGANGLKDSHDYYDYKALLERHMRHEVILGMAETKALGEEGKILAMFIPILKTDWTNCSPSLKEKAENVKKTMELVGENRATHEDLAKAVESLNDLSARIGKRLSSNQLLVEQREHIINEINKKISTSVSPPHADTSNDDASHERMDETTRGLLKSAERGVAIAQVLLAGRYSTGEGVDKNYELAAKWYEKAANQGNVEAQFQLGSLYYFGHGVTKDYTQAEKWLRKAAENGNAVSQYHLGNLYWEGKGVKKNQEEAIKWYVEAAKQGNDRAKTKLDNLRLPQSDLEKSSSVREAEQNATVAESSTTNRSSIEPSLAPLAVLRNGTIEEAKECVRLLDEELGKNPGNERASAVKAAIMDVFKAEASLIAAVSGTKDSEEQYRIKMQNLQVASRPSPLTGRVNTTEVERIRREAEAIKTGSESRVRNAKSALKSSIEEARRSAPTPDREALSRVWDQIERRNNL